MKKLWVILLCLLALACAFCACDENKTPNEDDTPSAVCQHRDADDNSLCDQCGESYTDGTDVTPTHTHAWGDWSVTTPATCQAKGVETRSCACGEDETRTVDTDPGAHTYDAENTCTVCLHYKDEGMVFTLKGSAYAVSDYTGNATEVIIPSTYKNIAVTAIGSSAFSGCGSLASITIPKSVTSIGTDAFYACNGLERITVESGNTKYHSAENCVIETESKTLIFGCKTGVIPTDGSVSSIGAAAFKDCNGLASITIPSSVTSIGRAAFQGCNALESITVESGNTKYHGAGNCLIETASQTLVLGCKASAIPTDGSVTSIGYMAFAYCSGLESITIPDSITSIGDLAFGNCTALSSIAIPDNVISIGKGAFFDCDSLASVTFGENSQLTSIGIQAFYDCNSLISITIPSQITSIDQETFCYCSRLTSVTLPMGLTFLGESAFYACEALASIKFCGTQSQWNAIFKSSWWDHFTGSYTVTYEQTSE